VKPPATLTVEPGTLVVGDLATKGTLVVFQGARLVADGTRDAPIVFTTSTPAGMREKGGWGGVVLMGNAPINTPGGTGIAEGGEADWTYGGTDPDDDSGILRYVRIEWAGIEVTPDNELNGLSLYGIGRGTILDHVQVHMGKDDGIEFFGGTVDGKYLLVTGADDDSFDWDLGYSGRGQFWLAVQEPVGADNGIEADNNKNDHGLLPRSHPVISNITLIGAGPDVGSAEDNWAWHARRGTAGEIYNGIFYGFDDWAFNIDDNATVAQAEADEMTLQYVLINDCDPNFPVDDAVRGGTTYEDPPFDEEAWFRDAARHNQVIDPELGDPINFDAWDAQPSATGPAAAGTAGPIPSDPWFDHTPTYIGAVDPDGTPWYEGWIQTAAE
jgi:hypothetical protein